MLLHETRGNVTIVRHGDDIGTVTRAGRNAAGYDETHGQQEAA